jgi:hypothetical protein
MLDVDFVGKREEHTRHSKAVQLSTFPERRKTNTPTPQNVTSVVSARKTTTS